MSGWLLFGSGVLGFVVLFATGLSWSRKTSDQVLPNDDGTPRSAAALNRLGRLVMFVAAPLFLLVFAALGFGFIADGAIEPVRFNQG